MYVRLQRYLMCTYCHMCPYIRDSTLIGKLCSAANPRITTLLLLTNMAIRRAQSQSPANAFLTDPSYSPGKESYHSYYQQLTEKMTQLEVAVAAVLRKQEQDYMSIYRSQMYTVYKELKEIRKRNEDTDLELKKNKELAKVRVMMEWFRDEALALREKELLYKRERDQWKAKAVGLEAELQALAKVHVAQRKNTKDVATDCRELFTPLDVRNTSPESRKDTEEPSKHLETIHHLQRIIEAERRKTRVLLASQQETSKTDLTSLFLEAVEEVRKQVKRRRAQSAARTHSPPKANALSSADKVQILELLVSREEVLELLYGRLFPQAPSPPKGLQGGFMRKGRFSDRSAEL